MAARLPKAFISWSSGKDSAYALLEARRQSIAEIVGIITTINTTDDRVAVHGVRQGLLTRQATALGLPLVRVELPCPCPNEIYEARFLDASVSIKAQGVEHIIFGDLFLEDIRTYREGLLVRAGMHATFPLWRRDTHSLAHEMIASGIVAHAAQCGDMVGDCHVLGSAAFSSESLRPGLFAGWRRSNAGGPTLRSNWQADWLPLEG